MNDAKVIWCKCGNRLYKGSSCPICPILEAVDNIDKRKEANDNNSRESGEPIIGTEQGN